MENAYLRLKSGVLTKAGTVGPSGHKVSVKSNPQLAIHSCDAQMPGPELSNMQLEMLTSLMRALCGYSGVTLNRTIRGVFIVASATIRPSGTLVVAMVRQLLIYTCMLRLNGVTVGQCVEASKIAASEAATEATCRVDRQTNGAVRLMGKGALCTLDTLKRQDAPDLVYEVNMLGAGLSTLAFLSCDGNEVVPFTMTKRSVLLVCNNLAGDYSFRRVYRSGGEVVEIRMRNQQNDSTPLIVSQAGALRTNGSYSTSVALLGAFGDALRRIMSGRARDSFLRTLQREGP